MGKKINFAFLLFSACLTIGAQGHLLFTAHLTGAKQVPSNNSTAEGFVSVILSSDLETMQVNGVFSGLSGPITAIRFHRGLNDMVGPAVVQLTNFLSGNQLAGLVKVPSDFIRHALNQNIYVNVVTQSFIGGEIRSQLEFQSDLVFPSYLTGAQHVPRVNTQASALGGLILRPGAENLQYFFLARGLSGPITAAHLHEGIPGRNGGPIFELKVVGNGNILQGDIPISSLPVGFFSKIKNDQYYINIRTWANPAGEIRGNIFYHGHIMAGGVLTGIQQVPPVNTAAYGLCLASLNFTLDSLIYFVLYDSLSGPFTKGHIHKGRAGDNGPIVGTLSAGSIPGTLQGRLALNADMLRDFLKNELYVNLYTAAFPDGEIRSQFNTSLRRAYVFDLCGQQQVPPNNSAGYGVAAISVGTDNTGVKYQLAVDGLSGPLANANIHQGAIGANGMVMFPLVSPKFYGEGFLIVDESQLKTLDRGEAYLNVTTANNPAGEIRGQISRRLGCKGISKTKNIMPANERQAVLKFRDGTLVLALDYWHDRRLSILVKDLTGRLCYRKAIAGHSGQIECPTPFLASGCYVAYVVDETTGLSTRASRFVVP